MFLPKKAHLIIRIAERNCNIFLQINKAEQTTVNAFNRHAFARQVKRRSSLSTSHWKNDS
jgi:hypothetical protein